MNHAVQDADGRRTRHEGRREALLDAVTTSVLTDGWFGRGLREVASDVGISHRTLLHHFGSREELLVEVLDEVRRREQAALDSEASAVGAGDAAAALALLDTWWRRVSSPEHLPVARLVIEMHTVAAVDPALSWYVDGAADRWVTLVATHLRRAMPSADGHEPLARMIYATVRGLQLELLAGGPRESVDAAHAVLRDRVAALLDEAARS